MTPAAQPSEHPVMPPGKRRSQSILPTHDLVEKSKHVQPAEARSSRRRRLLAYVLAFLIMLALSAALDVRRATVRDRPKLQLTLPSANALSSIHDPVSPPQPPNPPAPADASLSLRPFHLNPVAPPSDPSISHSALDPHPTVSADDSSMSVLLQPPTATDPDLPKKDPNLSEQELKDDVDQLIAHVDEEAAADSAAAAAKAAAEKADADTSSDNQSSDEPGTTPIVAPAPSQNATHLAVDQLPELQSANFSSTADVASLNSEEHFSGAQKRVDSLLADEQSKTLIDENDLRTLRALALQATRGDCEQKSGSEGGSLFKTDAEAASNDDIESTDPLWGAWCIFMGSYKSDAMRDYVIKQRVMEEKILAAKVELEHNSTDPVISTSFDPNAASLDDVLTPEQQSDLRLQTDRILGHLREYDIRYLAALSLQATFGDCGPYGKEIDKAVRSTSSSSSSASATLADTEALQELRKLREPLLEQTVTRREGAQWGAWCVLQGKKRTAAATELSQRLDLLVEQLAKSQAAADVGLEDVAELKDDPVRAENDSIPVAIRPAYSVASMSQVAEKSF